MLVYFKSVFTTSLFIIFIAVFYCNSVMAQDNSDAEKNVNLEEVVVTATRVDKSLYEVPASVGIIGKDDIQLGTQQLGLNESLVKIPGLFMQNRDNFAQDLRISIRGFGSRATFGIRGIKLYVDGIPATLPDGQGGVDSIDLGSTDRIEVIRGPSSSLYGTASGGVIKIFTEDGPKDGSFIEGRVSVGSYDFSKLQVKTGGQKEALNYLVNLSRLNLDGYRDHSETENTLLNSKFRYDIDTTSDLTLTANLVDSPEANDPGGLCSTKSASPFCTTFEANPRVAQRNNVRFDAGESVDQQQFGLVYNKSFSDKHEINARNYYVWRNFDANLPFGAPIGTGGIIALDRFFTGGGLLYSYTDKLVSHDNRLTVGFDIDSQEDVRKNWTNIRDSASIGPLVLNQDEDVFNWGVYIQDEFSITDELEFSFGVRYDEVEFEFTDKFFADGDQSGKVTFDELSPRVGLLWQFHNAINLFGNISTSFETPSTREFASPIGPGGFNTSLDAQTATNYEVGIKGLVPGKMSYQLSLFTIDTTDELLPAGQNAGGSTFFTNAGETTRNGIEAGMTFSPLSGLDISLAYTYSDFEFDKLNVSGTSFAGEKIPGIPEHNGFAEIAYYHPSGLYSVFDVQYVDEIFVNNAYIDDFGTLIPQSEVTDDYTVANFRMGYTTNISSNIEFSPFLGINNIFNQKYIGNIRVNEARHKFFEPAPELNVYAGFTLKYN
jgi:iron complex outermembrane receptor protein